MVDTPKTAPTRPWFEGIERWEYIFKAYHATENGVPKFPNFRAAVDEAGKNPKQHIRVELGGVAKFLLKIKDSPNQRKEDHPRGPH